MRIGIEVFQPCPCMFHSQLTFAIFFIIRLYYIEKMRGGIQQFKYAFAAPDSGPVYSFSLRFQFRPGVIYNRQGDLFLFGLNGNIDERIGIRGIKSMFETVLNKRYEQEWFNHY